MAYPKTNSGLTDRINSTLATQILIKVENTFVGAIQSISFGQNREINVFEEIGTEGVVDSCPKGAAKVDLTIERMVFDQLRITEAFARGFINIQAQRFPFDIQIIDTTMGDDGSHSVVTTCHGCWFKSYSPTYTVNSFLITERAGIQCEYITTMQSGRSAVYGGLRGIDFDYDTIERNTDVSGRKGRFDSSGITTKD